MSTGLTPEGQEGIEKMVIYINQKTLHSSGGKSNKLCLIRKKYGRFESHVCGS